MKMTTRHAKSVLTIAILLSLCCIPLSFGEVAEWTLITEIDTASDSLSRMDESTLAISVREGFYLLDTETWRMELLNTIDMGLFFPYFVRGPNDLWAAARSMEDGLPTIWRRDSASGDWVPYPPIDVLGTLRPWVYPLWIDGNGNPWAGVDSSVQTFDGEQWQCLMGGDDLYIICDTISEGPDGNVWIGSQYGIFSWSYELFFQNLYSYANTGLPLASPFFGFHDSRGLYWIGGLSKLHVVFEGKGYSLSSLVSGFANSFISIDEDSQGNVWLGSCDGKGLIVIRPNNEIVHLPAPEGHGYGLYTYFSVKCADDGFTYVTTACGDPPEHCDVWAVRLE